MTINKKFNNQFNKQIYNKIILLIYNNNLNQIMKLINS